MSGLGEYTIAWSVYVLASFGLLFVSARIVRGIPWSYPRHVLWLLVAVILLTPATAVEGYWAPAWIIGTLEALFGGTEKALDISRILSYVLAAAVALYTLANIIWRVAVGGRVVQDAKASPTPSTATQPNKTEPSLS